MHPCRRDARYTPLQEGDRGQHSPLTHRAKGAKGLHYKRVYDTSSLQNKGMKLKSGNVSTNSTENLN